MAFQRSSSDHRLALNLSVLSLDAGEDQFRICDSDATLSATITLVEDDPFNHAIIWEQISGSLVTWITPLNILTVSYTSINDDDKTFRVYADKGTPFVRSSDITVFGTPTSESALNLSGNSTDATSALRGTTATCRAPMPTVMASFSIEDGYNFCGVDPNNWSITVVAPECDAGSLVSVTLQWWNVNQWVDIGTNNTAPHTFTSVPHSVTLRAQYVYVEYNNVYTQYSPFVWTTSTSNIITLADHLPSNIQGSPESATSIADYNVNTVSLKSKEVTSTGTLMIIGSPESATSILDYNVNVVSLKAKEVTSTGTLTIIGSPEATIVITGYDVVALTNIDIGG